MENKEISEIKRIFVTRLDALDHILSVGEKHFSDMNAILKERLLTSQPGLGTTKWLLEGQYKAQVEPMGTIYNVGLADLFLATQTEKA